MDRLRESSNSNGGLSKIQTASITTDCPKEIGHLDPTHQSNLRFGPSDVDRDLSGVLGQMQEWKARRAAWIVAAATQARCFALNIFRDDGSHVQTLVDTAFKIHERCSQAEFIGCCILLKGCAKLILDDVGTAGPRKSGATMDQSFHQLPKAVGTWK